MQGAGHTIARLERALGANAALQARLGAILEAIDKAIWGNAQAQARLAHNSQLHPRAGRYKGMRGNAPHIALAHQATLY